MNHPPPLGTEEGGGGWTQRVGRSQWEGWKFGSARTVACFSLSRALPFTKKREMEKKGDGNLETTNKNPNVL